MELSEAVRSQLHVLPSAGARVVEQQHAAFLERFPRTAWDDMTLEQYALGTERTRESYSYALEWGTTRLGSIRGGTSAKHVIFQRRSNGAWHYPSAYESVETAWLDLRQAFRRALELASEARWSDIALLAPLATAKVVKLKTLYLYSPDDLLPVYSSEHLRHFAERLNLDPDPDLVGLNRQVFTALRATPGLEHLTGQPLGRLLYRWAPPPGWLTPTWLKIAPGPQASKWQECQQGGFICVGWDDVGDLSSFDDEEDFRDGFAAAYPYKGNKSQVTRKAKELWRLTQLKAGDRIVANRGTSEVVGIGTVTDSAYEWRPERDEYKHTVGVDWDPGSGHELDPPVKAWATTTILPVPRQLITRLTETPPPDVGPGLAAEVEFVEWEKVLQRKKQLIFYGPPGTGKTRAARAFARWWLATELSLSPDLDPDAVEHELTYRGHAAAAWWITANPDHWSWDEMFADDHVGFRRGKLARNYERAQSGDVVVCYEAAPKRRVVGLARVVDVREGDVDEPLRLLPIRRFPGGVSWNALEQDLVTAPSEPVRHRAQGTLFALTNEEFRRILELSGEVDTYLDNTPDDLASFLTQVTFHASYSYEDFVEG